jgi:hypothetical protein
MVKVRGERHVGENYTAVVCQFPHNLYDLNHSFVESPAIGTSRMLNRSACTGVPRRAFFLSNVRSKSFNLSSPGQHYLLHECGFEKQPGGTAMAKVIRCASGYEFTGLSAVGMRLVNEFQRYHSELCIPSSDPSYRFIHHGSIEQNLELGKLVAEVRARDPETPPPSKTRR